MGNFGLKVDRLGRHHDHLGQYAEHAHSAPRTSLATPGPAAKGDLTATAGSKHPSTLTTARAAIAAMKGSYRATGDRVRDFPVAVVLGIQQRLIDEHGHEWVHDISEGHWPTTNAAEFAHGLVAASARHAAKNTTGEANQSRIGRWLTRRISGYTVRLGARDHHPEPMPLDPHRYLACVTSRMHQAYNHGQPRLYFTHLTDTDPETGAARRSLVVNIPGTKVGFGATGVAADIITLAGADPSAGGAPNPLTEAVRTAIRRELTVIEQETGQAPGTATRHVPIMLVGHSLGGMVAADLAVRESAASETSLRIVSVVTLGAPIARYDIPEHVSVLTFAHDQDHVPKLDGDATNPERWHSHRARADVRGPLAFLHSHVTSRYETTIAAFERDNGPVAAAWRTDNAAFLHAAGSGEHQEVSCRIGSAAEAEADGGAGWVELAALALTSPAEPVVG